MKSERNKAAVLGIYFLLIFLLGICSLPFYEKGDFELGLNLAHHPIYDTFFSSITHLGDGLILLIPLALFVFYRYSTLVLLLLSSFLHLILVHIGKKWLFPGTPRPVEFFKDISFYEIPHVSLHHWGSFPSGHTATAFMLASFLCLVVPKKFNAHYFFMGIAVLIGLSRVYLMQHFLVDVWAGALLGILSALVSYLLVLKFFSNERYKKSLFQKFSQKATT